MVVVLLLLLSGDVETNPGPVGEFLYDVSLTEPDSHAFCVRVWLCETSMMYIGLFH